MRNLISIVDYLTEDTDIELHDQFDIELDDIIIESCVIGFTDDGVIIEGDDTVCELFADKNIDLEYIAEAEYHGRKVELGKPSSGDVKKSKVYVRNAQGNVVKVNFGDKTMRIKKSNPARRKSFRARHNCANPGPRWKARYWSCRAW